MKRALVIFGLLALAVWMAAQVGGGTPRPVAALFPAGPALYLEAKDFQSLMNGWNNSAEKRLWLASDQYEVFSRSNLLLKLQRAQGEFAAAAGVPPDLALLSNVAGAESALAIYDIGKLEFLYITRMPAARITDSALWKTRGKYEPRKSSGLDYYVKYDKTSQRVAAFASAKDYLMLATREDLLAGALALLAAQNATGMTAEPWYAQSAQAAKTPGELRLVLNLPRLLQSPYMRSYWIQRNASELKQFSSAVSDVTRTPASIAENRLLFRVAEETPSWNEDAVSQIVRVVPANAGVYRAWASPTAEQAFELMRAKILEPQPGSGPESYRAPVTQSLDSVVGTEADLETRIDEAPLAIGPSSLPDDARKLLASTKLQAMLYVGGTRLLPDGVFVGIDSAVVLLGASNWDAAAAKAAFNAQGAIATSGPLLILANRPEFLQAILAGVGNPPSALRARYAAAYQHGRELANFEKMMRLIDNPLRSGDNPMFFSQTVGSFGQSMLGRLDSASVVVHDAGATVSQNVVYKLKP